MPHPKRKEKKATTPLPATKNKSKVSGKRFFYRVMRKLFLFTILIPLFLIHCNSTNTIYIGRPHNLSVQVPVEYQEGFVARAFVMWCDRTTPAFKGAVSVEAIDGSYSCSLQVFLGDVKVWNSGHYSRFYTADRCLLELNTHGDLQLKGRNDQVGWRTGTSGQGVERLQILKTGNLVLLDGMNRIKWQSFNFPTDMILWGQRLDVATSLTTFHNKSTPFYSFEIRRDKVTLYLNSGSWRYSYWEFKPSKNRNISYLQLSSSGLELFNDRYKKIAQIPSQNPEPLRFLALGKERGNLGLYFYSAVKKNFEVSFQALNTTCDLPLACKPYGICTLDDKCSCIRIKGSDCGKGVSDGFCGMTEEVEMVELEVASSVLRERPKRVNVSKEECGGLCLGDCMCAAALYSYSGRECFVYGLVAGVRQVDGGSGMSYMIKVPKGSDGGHGKSELKKWVLVLVVVADGLIVLLVLGGVGYYLIRKRKKAADNTVEEDT